MTWAKALEVYDAYEDMRDGLLPDEGVERQIEHHKRAYVRGEIGVDELDRRVGRLLTGLRAIPMPVPYEDIRPLPAKRIRGCRDNADADLCLCRKAGRPTADCPWRCGPWPR
jgi:hypothetical protein